MTQAAVHPTFSVLRRAIKSMRYVDNLTFLSVENKAKYQQEISADINTHSCLSVLTFLDT
jgi:hypothetical protein